MSFYISYINIVWHSSEYLNMVSVADVSFVCFAYKHETAVLKLLLCLNY